MKLSTIHIYPQVFKTRRQEEISEVVGEQPIPKDKPTVKSIRRHLEKTLLSYETGRERLYHANDMVLNVIKRYERDIR